MNIGLLPWVAEYCGMSERILDVKGLSCPPPVLRANRALRGMAPGERAALMGLVRRLATEGGVAVLFTEHDVDVVFEVADRVMVLDRGALIAEGAPAAVRADPRVREVYLGDAGR